MIINNNNYKKILVMNNTNEESIIKQKKVGLIVLDKFFDKTSVFAELYHRSVDALLIYPSEEEGLNAYFSRFARAAEKNGISTFYIIDGKPKPFIDEQKKTIKNREEAKSISTAIRMAQEGISVTEEEKVRLRKYIPLFSLDFPQDESEWVIVKQQISYYQKHKRKIGYSYDKNLYFKCRKCLGLTRRGEEHRCYAEESTNIYDLRVSGGEI